MWLHHDEHLYEMRLIITTSLVFLIDHYTQATYHVTLTERKNMTLLSALGKCTSKYLTSTKETSWT